MEQTLIVDRLEGEYAVCETPSRKMVAIPLGELPSKLWEGDVLVRIQDGYQKDEKATRELRKKNRELLESLWEDE